MDTIVSVGNDTIKMGCRTLTFFQLLKRERIRRKTYPDRESARCDVFDYIEMFYNPKRRHDYTNKLSPVEFERQHFNTLESV